MVISGKLLAFILAVIATVNSQATIKTAPYYAVESLPVGTILSPRGILVDQAGNILVGSIDHVYTIYEENGRLSTADIVSRGDLGLVRGLAYSDGYLYVSSPNTVFRWGYYPGQRKVVSGEPEVIVNGIPSQDGYESRTLAFDRNYLYVSVGSTYNVTNSLARGRIMRYNLKEGLPSGGHNFTDGEIFAQGLRNVVGLALWENVLWGVDCAPENLTRPDLGPGNIQNTNPADELMRFDYHPGANYGYPFCWSVYDIKYHARGDQLSWPGLEANDAYCQLKRNNIPPTLPLPAHYSPLGITFYDGKSCENLGAFPCTMKGDAFVAFHGSQYRDPPAGYRVARLSIDNTTGLPTGKIMDVVYEPDPKNCGRKCFRPVDLAFLNGHLIITADQTNEVIRVKYGNEMIIPTFPPSDSPSEGPTPPTTTMGSDSSLLRPGMLAVFTSLFFATF